MNEYKLLEEDITSALNRIHIIRPKDFSNGSVAALESLYGKLITGGLATIDCIKYVTLPVSTCMLCRMRR